MDLSKIGSIVEFDQRIWERDKDEEIVPHTLMIYGLSHVNRHSDIVKLNEEFYGSPYSIGDEMDVEDEDEDEDEDDDREYEVAGYDDDPAGYGSGLYTQFYCHAENKRRVRILVEWEPDSHMDCVRDMWIRQNGKWESLNVEYGGVWGGGKDVGFDWIY